ncbi:MAG: PTS sugar transporter subunit IIA [Gemmataceae bacterium]
MQLTVREVGKFLNVSEATVTRWIKQRGLPAQYVAGQYRFHRAELLEWATANQIKVAPELFDHPDTDDEPASSLAAALEAGGIFYGLKDTDKDRALRALIDVLPLPDGIDREFLLRLFQAREAAASTAIGDGVALPHVRNPIVLHVDRPSVTLAFLERPVDFGALDGKPVQVLFSLICPTTRSHLQMLARLSFAMHDPRFKDVVLRQARPDEILGEARRLDAALAPTAGKATP